MNLESMMHSMNEEMSNPDAYEQPKGDKFKADERFYKISKSKDGNGSVKIRFIPSFNGEKTKLNTFVSKPVHTVTQYKTIGGEKKKRFITENCPKIHGKDKECPICDHAWDNYNLLIDSDEKAAKEFPKNFAPKTKYITNIMIIEDAENPSNEGKIFLFEYGEQIQKLIKKQSQPTAEEISEKGLKPFNAWDLMTGRDFRLKLKDGKFTENGFPSWDDSFFVTDASAHVADMKAAGALFEAAFVLDEFIDSTHIPTVETLQKSLNYVLFKQDTKKATSDTPAASEKKADLSSSDELPTQMDMPPFDETPVKSAEAPKPSVAESSASSVDDFFNQFNN